MKILVTGGAGYIGAHVVHELISAGHNPVIYDNLYSGQRVNIPPGVPFIEGDISDAGLLDKALAGTDAVMHLAALKAAGESMTHPEKYAEKNIAGTIVLLNAMCRAGQTPAEPLNFYGFTKLKMEEICRWYSALGKIRFAALRYFNVTGYDIHGRVKGLEINPNNLFPIIMEVLAGTRTHLDIFGTDYDTPDGTCIRDYIHVSDLAAGHLQALDYILRTDEDIILNLGTSSGLSVKEAAQKAQEISGIKMDVRLKPRRPGDGAKLTLRLYSRQRKIGLAAKIFRR
ncbi:hypothetical protein CHS0354_018434 [Potamilus streckersoni]|uniref:NAD-dependent epimerase/dehydratase domain-containing protein n=1 Tax=Potamilus streckersoni TaxID=2493646 RepID=A0AAE0WB08_9BIVA|nr:hypothetical protein CHS0354_018434 [Potamilus streckersoni]